jgi:hypothetical protein
MTELEKALSRVIYIRSDIEEETDKMLDAWQDDKDYPIPHYTITFNGLSVDIPLDFAEINNEIQDHLENLINAIKEYTE